MHRVRVWLRICERDHALCNALRNVLDTAEMPTRLLAVDCSDPSRVRLQETTGMDKKPYVALSYCWGGPLDDLKTMKANIKEKMAGIDFQSLPKTIKDAVNVTRQLQYQYLWIDALCIVQDDDGDKNRELRKMAQIYTGASLVIDAARARGSHEGFLQARDLAQIYHTVYELQIRGQDHATHPIYLHERSVENDTQPVDSRAWTLQEHKLAIRRLRFGSNQTEWACRQSENVDGGCDRHSNVNAGFAFNGEASERLLKPHTGDLQQTDIDERYDAWMQVVTEYSARNLSYASDKLPAFAALAERFDYEMPGHASSYCAGIWGADMPSQLLWRRATQVKSITQEENAQNTIPSWSWASSGAVEFHPFPFYARQPPTLKIIDCQIMLQDQTLCYGKVQSGILIVEGHLFEFSWDGRVVRNIVGDGSVGTSTLRIKLFFDFTTSEWPEQLWCLEICSHAGSEKSYGIVLRKLSESTFRRVGYYLSCSDQDMQDDQGIPSAPISRNPRLWARQEISII